MNMFEFVRCSKNDIRVHSIKWCSTHHYDFATETWVECYINFNWSLSETFVHHIFVAWQNGNSILQEFWLWPQKILQNVSSVKIYVWTAWVTLNYSQNPNITLTTVSASFPYCKFSAKKLSVSSCCSVGWRRERVSDISSCKSLFNS